MYKILISFLFAASASVCFCVTDFLNVFEHFCRLMWNYSSMTFRAPNFNGATLNKLRLCLKERKNTKICIKFVRQAEVFNQSADRKPHTPSPRGPAFKI